MSALSINTQSQPATPKSKDSTFQRLLLIAYVILVLGVFTFRDFMSVPIQQYLLVAIVGAYIPFASYKNLVSYTAFLIPIVTGMNTIICACLFIGLLVKCPKINKAQYLFTIALVIIEIINLKSWPSTYRINDVILYFGILSLFLFLFFDKTQNIDYPLAIKLFCIATIFVFAAICYRTYQVFGPIGIFAHRMGDVSIYDESLSADLRVFSLNCNNIGYFSTVLYACLLLGYKRLHLSPILYYAIFISNILIAALTVSRTWLLMIVLLTLLYGVMYLKRWKLIVLISATIIFGGGLAVYFSDFIEPFQKRLTNGDIETANGRTEIFSEYLTFMSENAEALPLGLGAVSYSDITGCSYSTHNATQQIFVCTGIMGLMLFTAISLVFFRMFIRRRHIKLIFLLPLLSALLFVQTIQFLNPYFLMLPFIIGAMSIKMGATQNSDLSLR